MILKVSGKIVIDADALNIDTLDSTEINDAEDVVEILKNLSTSDLKDAIYDGGNGTRISELGDDIDISITEEEIVVKINDVEFDDSFIQDAEENGIDIADVKSKFKNLEFSTRVSSEFEGDDITEYEEKQAILDEIYYDLDYPEIQEIFQSDSITSIDYNIVKRY